MLHWTCNYLKGNEKVLMNCLWGADVVTSCPDGFQRANTPWGAQGDSATFHWKYDMFWCAGKRFSEWLLLSPWNQRKRWFRHKTKTSRTLRTSLEYERTTDSQHQSLLFKLGSIMLRLRFCCHSYRETREGRQEGKRHTPPLACPNSRRRLWLQIPALHNIP